MKAHLHPQHEPTTAAYQPWLIWGLAASFFFSMYVIRVSPSVIHLDLVTAFQADATSLSLLVAFFYYAYLAMQIPAGILLDRYGPRLLLSIAVILCAVSAYLLSDSFTLEHASYSRLLLGTVSAFAFVGSIKLATTWFPPQKLGLVVGVTQGLGMLGASFGQGPMAYLNHLFGWRSVYLGMAGLFCLLATLIFLFVRNQPPKLTTHRKNEQESHSLSPHPEHYFRNVLWDRTTWINALYAGLIFAPVEVFGEFWGVTYMEKVHHIEHQLAANASSLIFIGWFIGGPLAGWLSNHVGRKPVMVFSACCGLVLTPLVLYWPQLSNIEANILMFLFGLTNGGLIASYTVASELHPKHSTGLCMGITNMISVIIGSAMHPVIGALLDTQASLDAQGLPLYNAENYRHAMVLVPACSLLALIFSFFVKETLPKRSRSF